MAKSKMKNQTKSFNFEVKEIDDEGKFSGYASVFDVIDFNGDIIIKGAFEKSIAEKTPLLLWQHDHGQPIGVFERINEDNKGLYVEGRLLLDIEKAREVFILLKNRAIRGLSIGYVSREWEWKNEGELVRVLKDIDLWEISLVSFPANEAALVDDIKSIHTTRDAEEYLREAGISRTHAKAIIAAVKSGIRCDDEDDETITVAKNLLSKMRGE